MASASAILASGSDLQELDGRGVTLVQAELLREIIPVTSSPSTLLSSGKDFQALSDHDLVVCVCELLREIDAITDSPSTIMLAGEDFQELDANALLVAQTELMREIAGVTSSPSALLLSGKLFQELSPRNLYLAIVELFREWKGSTASPSTLLASGKDFYQCADRDLQIIIAELLRQKGSGPPTPTCTVPTGLTAAWQLDTTTIVTWDVPPAGNDYTEIWTSTDNITFVLSASVAAPAITVTLPASVAAPYVKIRFCVASAPAKPSAYWEFEEASGTRFDSIGVTDNNLLVATGSDAQTATGLIGIGAKGKTSVSPFTPFLQSTAGTALTYVPGTGLTISMWIKWLTLTGTRMQLEFNPDALDFLLKVSPTDIVFDFSPAAGSDAVATLANVFTVGPWHLIIAQYNPATQKTQVSIDGGALTTSAVTASDAGSVTPAVFRFNPINAPDVVVDEVGIWLGTVLDASAISYLYNAGAGRRPPL